MLPHAEIHRGGDDDGACMGDVIRRKRVIRKAPCHFRDDVGGGGGDEQQIRLFGQVDVFGLPVRRVPKICDNGISGDCEERSGRDELHGGFRHDDMDVMTRLDELRTEIGAFVGGDGASDAENDDFFHVVEFQMVL